MNAIVTKNLTKRFDDRTAVDALSFEVKQGELFSLLGVNGAGKTTTIKMLSSILAPTSGDALLLNASIVSEPRAVKRMINLSPQETAVARNLTVRENLEMIAGIYGSGRASARRATDEMLRLMGLEREHNRRAKTLSGGMQRRLSIGMALITKPKILFLDEPTLGLDVLARRSLWTLIESLKGDVTMVLTTHYMEESEALSDRVGVMANGKLIATGTVDALKTKTGTASLEDAFVKLAGEVVR